ncbi:ABC transporter permease [Microbacterium sp. A93]|uniref:ABC transporter permease n=1 Tax=Microbacterium sp. A93 TaxID=3450716 RepID=UPI003F42FADB
MPPVDQAPEAGPTVRTISLERGELVRVGARPPILEYLRQLWKYRSFIMFDSQSRVSGDNNENTLGRLWLVLNPILNGATYYFVFGLLLGTGRGIENFIAYLIIGVFMFRFTSSAITSGARSITNNRAVVRAFQFPRATLPLAVNVRELLVQIPAFITMFVLILVIPPFEPITWKWLMFVPLVALQVLFNVGLSLLLARWVTKHTDIVNLISFGTRIWLYLSAVFFSLDRFEGNPVVMSIMELNPMFCVLDIARDCLLYNTWPDPQRWIVLGAWTVVMLVVGMLVFWRAEETYGVEN